MAGDEELNALLEELDRQTAAENPDQAVERARESLEETIAGLKLTPEEEMFAEIAAQDRDRPIGAISISASISASSPP